METAIEYLEKTRSSVEHLLSGIQSYIDVLHETELPIFIYSGNPGDDDEYQNKYEEWVQKSDTVLKRRLEKEDRYFSETFAQMNLCGALIQVAYMGISLFSQVDEDFMIGEMEIKGKPKKFCVGRHIRSLPQGLLILAGRNQYMHFEDDLLRFPNNLIFDYLATHDDYGRNVPYRDPAFDLANEHIISYSSNITAVMGWRNYEIYEADMKVLLGC